MIALGFTKNPKFQSVRMIDEKPIFLVDDP